MPRLPRVLNYDLMPQVSRRVRRVVRTPLGCLVLAALTAGLCGLVVHPRVFALAGGLGAVVAAGACWPWVTVRGVRAAVRFDRARAAEGEPVAAEVTVANHLPWPAWGLVVRGGYGPAGAGDPPAVRLGGVAARSEVTFRWPFAPPGRGEYPLAPPRLATGFPFGVREAGRPAGVAGRLLVRPRTYPVGPVPATDGDDPVEGNVARNKVGSTGDVLGARPYRRGDSPRRIHWAQSAKHDRLIVCELQANTRPVVVLVLDADPAVHTAGRDGSREWAVRVTASLAAGWLAAGARVGAAWAGTAYPPAAGPAQADRILDALARLPDRAAAPVGDVLRAAAGRGGVRIGVTTDAGLARLSRREADACRWVVLDRAGFGGPERPDAGHELDSRQGWLRLPGPDRVPHLLRFGWSEARHGS